LFITFSPLSVFADTPPSPLAPLAPIIIAEVQPGSQASASEEFIELYNTTAQEIDLAAFHWQLEIVSTTATSWSSPFRVVPLTGHVAAGESYIVASSYQANGQTV